jgi:hypothetical protein
MIFNGIGTALPKFFYPLPGSYSPAKNDEFLFVRPGLFS